MENFAYLFPAKAAAYAVKCHRSTNHLYDGHAYETHLNMVFGTALKFIHLIPESDRQNVLAACWTHDVIEDTRQTYNDVKQATNEIVAELTYALTNEKGRSRAERANKKYYQGIQNTKYASFVKLCDRIANVEYSKKTASTMFAKYRKENEDFITGVFDKNYLDMIYYLDNLFPETC